MLASGSDGIAVFDQSSGPDRNTKRRRARTPRSTSCFLKMRIGEDHLRCPAVRVEGEAAILVIQNMSVVDLLEPDRILENSPIGQAVHDGDFSAVVLGVELLDCQKFTAILVVVRILDIIQINRDRRQIARRLPGENLQALPGAPVIVYVDRDESDNGVDLLPRLLKRSIDRTEVDFRVGRKRVEQRLPVDRGENRR